MIKRLIIDIPFINKWEKKYDEIENDENEYNEIIQLVQNNKSTKQSISKEIFIKILKWKSPRLMGIVKLNRFERDYAPILKSCLNDYSSANQLNSLEALYGIGIPTASTILHFMHPDKFPIMDIRTAETMKHFGLLESESISKMSYWKYNNIISKLKGTSNKSLRIIDRALFAYHKAYLNKESILYKAEESCQDTTEGLNGEKRFDDKSISDNKNIVLNAKVRNLYNKDTEGWERKEMLVKYNGHLMYPKVRDEIYLEDNADNTYKLCFIKGANKKGWICLGKPGKLKQWFVNNEIKNNQNIRLQLISYEKKLFKLLL